MFNTFDKLNEFDQNLGILHMCIEFMSFAKYVTNFVEQLLILLSLLM